MSLSQTKKLLPCKLLQKNLASMYSTLGLYFIFQLFCFVSDCLSHSVKKNSPENFTLLVASVETKVSATHDIEIFDKKAKLMVEYGDFSGPLSKTVAALKEVDICYITETRSHATRTQRQGSTPRMRTKKR